MRNTRIGPALCRITEELLRGKNAQTALRCKRDFLLKPEFASAYNAALLYYRAGRYQSACLWARLAEAQGHSEEKTEALILGLFALQTAVSPAFRQEVKKLPAVTDRGYASDRFVLTFLSGDREAALAQIPSLLDTWYLDVPELAMVMSCLLDQGNIRAADDALHRHLAQLQDSPYRQHSRAVARQMKKARFSKGYRKKLIKTYRYGHPLL